jgi:hypothetical protein
VPGARGLSRQRARTGRGSAGAGEEVRRGPHGQAAAGGEDLEHRRGVGDPDAGEVLGAGREVGEDRVEGGGVRRAVLPRQRGDRIGRAGERLAAGAGVGRQLAAASPSPRVSAARAAAYDAVGVSGRSSSAVRTYAASSSARSPASSVALSIPTSRPNDRGPAASHDAR